MLPLTFILEQKARSRKILLLEGTPPFNGVLLIIFRLKARHPGLPLCEPVSLLLALAAKAFLFFLAQFECSRPCYLGLASAQRLADLGLNSLASGLFHTPNNGPALKPTLASGPGASAQASLPVTLEQALYAAGHAGKGASHPTVTVGGEIIHPFLGAECPELPGSSLSQQKKNFNSQKSILKPLLATPSNTELKRKFWTLLPLFCSRTLLSLKERHGSS